MNAATLLDVLLDAARTSPDQVVVHVRGDGGESTVTYRQLLDQALHVAGGFREAGVAPGTCVPLIAERGEDFQPLFWGALAAGLVPVPLAPDARRVRPVWEHLGGPPVAVDASCAPVAGELPDGVRVLRAEELREGPPLADPATPAPDDLAFLQFSSGSTGAPKGVELTHAAVVANLRQLTAASALTERDVVLSWMPYFHDMGLIGTHLAPLAARARQVRIAPLSFAKNPRLWFETASAHRATVLSAANFALALTVRRVPEEVCARLDLSAVRLLLVGAEPISATVWRAFTRRARTAGLDPRAATPVYGLAEATLGVTFPPPGEVAAPVVLDRDRLSRGHAVEREPGAGAVELMDVGAPVPGCEVRVTDDRGRPLGDRRVGHIEVRGPQLARGYHRLPSATAESFAGGWLRTGDLGFLRDGRLCVSGRAKDVLFVNGRTFHAPDMEDVAAATPGVPAGTTVVVGSTDPVTGGERVVVFVAWARPPASAGEVLDMVARRVRAALGHDDVRVLALPPSSFPRTTSGKVRRQRMRARFEADGYRPSASSGTAREPAVRTPEGTAPPRSRREVRRTVRDAWARVLAVPEPSFGDRDRFAELGGTSLKAMEVLAALEDALGVPLEPAVLRNDTVSALTDPLLDVRETARAGWPAGRGGDGRGVGGGADGTTSAVGADGGDGADGADGGTGVDRRAGGSGDRAVGRAGGQPVPAPPTAVLALACRFPGADTPEEFWDLLVSGRDAVTTVPPGRWDDGPGTGGAGTHGGVDFRAGHAGAEPGGDSGAGRRAGGAPGTARWGAFLDDPASFDAGHFTLDDAEARALDPQARIFLELAHEALERAGYAGARRRGLRVGVFAAVGDSGYRQVLADAGPAYTPPAGAALTGTLPNLVAARVAHCLDLDGPALVVDTACSSGLVALHLARRSLADGECDLAVVGGVNLHLTPDAHRALEAAQALSPTGRSRAFAADADGFVPGEGGAALVLRPLPAARRQDDDVLAVVRGTAVNNDGTSLSLMAPNPLRQREVITRAYEVCGVDPASVTYVEAHGTGTPVGDPIELRSLAHAFPARPDGRRRLLGSVKTNVGHLLNAAALPSLVKTVLALRHGRLPASLHGTRPSPAVERAGFALVTEATRWDSDGPRRAGVNAFGFGGTNAHAVLEEAPPAPVRPPHRDGAGPRLLTLSAGSAAGLDAWAARLTDHLRERPDLAEGDVCRSAAQARDERPHRLAVVVDGDLRERLAALRTDSGAGLGAAAGTVTRRPRTVFVLPGQGAPVPARGRELYATAPVYRATLDEASAVLDPVHGRELTAWCADTAPDVGELAATEVAQPLLVAHGVALARQLAAWGVRPDAVVGHSVGELTAACVAGMLSLPDTLAFAAERGRLMGASTAPGAMAAVRGADEGEVADLVGAAAGTLAVAAYNGPGRLVLSGTPDAVRRAAERLTGRGATVRPLEVTRAFHSPLMEPVAEALTEAARKLAPKASDVPLMSTLTARWESWLSPEHLREHALRPVRFGRAVERLAEEGYDTFVALGADGGLAGPVRAVAARCRARASASANGGAGGGADGAASDAGSGSILVVSAPARPEDAGVEDTGAVTGPGGARELLATVARLWVRGVPLDRTELDAGTRRVPLPPYPYQRRRYWPGPLPDDGGLLHEVVWRPAPPAAGSPAGAVLVTGPDDVAVRRLTDALKAEGVRALAGDVHDAAPDGERPATVLLLAGPVRLGPAGGGGTDVRGAASTTAAGPDADQHGAAPGPAHPGTATGPDTGLHGAVEQFRDALALVDRYGARRLLLVTEDVHVTGRGVERPVPGQAVLGGLALAVDPESAGASAHWVDLASADDALSRVRAVAAELSVPRTPEPVAWRGGRRWRRTVTAGPGTAGPGTDAPGTDAPGTDGPSTSERAVADRLPADGTYLLTGGAGALGSALARDLAGRGRPVLVLTGRSVRPPRGLLEELTALGADARYVTADLTVPDQVERLVAGLPPLDAVFHAAGVVRPGSLRGTDVADTLDVLAVKTAGTVLLAEALGRHGRRAGLCVAFSSVASVLPGLAGALGAYAAANAFLDAFAGAERRAGRPWLSVNFGPFAGPGMAAGAADAGVLAGPAGRPLAIAPALAALQSVCGTDTAQVVLADLGTGASRTRPDEERARPAVTAAPSTDRPAGPSLSPAPARPAATAGAGEAASAGGGHAALLRELLAQSLGIPASGVDDDTPFLGLGLDSLSAVDLVKRLERRTGRDLPATLFFEYRTVRELAARLDRPEPDGSPRAGARTPEAVSSGAAATGEGVPFPLTPVQLALHTSSRLHPEVPARGHLRMTVRGPLDPGLLGRALESLAERHGMLRLRVDDGGPLPVQRVAPPAPLSDWYEVRACPARDLTDAETALCNRPFDLAAGPPVRAVLLREEPELAHLLLVAHHAAADGYSLNLLAEELWTVYTALHRGESPHGLPAAPEFARHAAATTHGAPEADLRYWRQRLAGLGEPLRLPYDTPPPGTAPGAPVAGPVVQHHGELGAEPTRALERLAAAHDVSLFHLLLAAYVRCLARWSGRPDIAVNVARARREDRFDGVERLVGPLADTLPLLCRTTGGEPLVALAERVRLAWLESERHAGPSSLDLAGLLPGAGTGPRTVSPAGFSFARFPARLADGCPVEVRATAAGTGSAATRLSLLCWSDGPVLRMAWNFPAPLFARTTVARLDREFRAELAALLAPEEPGAPLPAPSRRDHAAGAPRPVPVRADGSVPLIARLLARFRDRPGAIAVETGDASLTYEQLDRASARLAARLRADGVRPGDLVGLLTEPGADTVTGVVGILRAGAGWVPLDPDHPEARLTGQLACTGATVVVCHAATRDLAGALDGARPVPVDAADADAGGYEERRAAVSPAAAPDLAVTGAEAVAYVIFTSGSTGRPKAVPISHRAMENYLDWAVATFGYGPADRLARTASPCFDASVRQLLAPLMVGGTVVSASRDLLRDPEMLLAHVERTRITVWSSVPTVWEQLLSAAEERVRNGGAVPDLSALRWVHVGGEALPAGHVRRWFDLFGRGARIANLYGPTETTVNATCHVIDARPADTVRQVPVGRPVAGTDLAVIGADGTPCGPGEPGELLIAGTGLTDGYLGEPELTARAFVVRDGRRWYRSGDRVRWSADGELEFLGRLDDQVKIRGNRVEPGEVEAALQTHPGVGRAVVIAREGRLHAFVTVRAGAGRPGTRDMRRHLATLLPPYMVPARLTVVDAMPLTGTGKVDRAALTGPGVADRTAAAGQAEPPRAPGRARHTGPADPAAGSGTSAGSESSESSGGTAPATPTERRLAAIWSALLPVASVGRDDDFFDLGGDSLLVLQVFDRLAEDGRPLPRPTVIYRHRTLAALASAVDAAGPPEAAGVPSAARVPAPGDGTAGPSGPFPVTPGQRGFLLAEALSPGAGTWLARLRLSGLLDPDLFQRAVDLLVERHGMLRTVFPAGARPPVQQELPRSLRLPVEFETVTGRDAVDERAAAESRRRLDTWAWPLVRLRVLTLSPREHVLLVHAHHVIADGYSAALLMRELTEVYDRLTRGEAPLPDPLRADFRDHVLSARAPAVTSTGTGTGLPTGTGAVPAEVAAPYRPPVLRSPVRGVAATGSADLDFHATEFTLDASRTAALRKLASDARTTLHAPLLTAYHQELAVLTGRGDLVVGLAVSGRDDRAVPDVHRVFGPFASAVPVRAAPSPDRPLPDADFGRALRRVAAAAEEARAQEEVPAPHHPDGLPLTAQFFFTFLDFAALAPAGDSVLRVSWDAGDGASAFLPPSSATDVFMAVRPEEDGLRVTVRGSAAAFSAGALEAFARAVRDRLVRAAGALEAGRAAGRRGGGPVAAMDAALVGYLPAPDHLARLAGLPAGALPREEVRGMLFPEGAPRLLETVSTGLGRSGFVCVPLFADELAGGPDLVAHVSRAVSLAASGGARCVSLAGMIPSLTGYGFDVLRAGRQPAAVTTGHATTVVSVVKTVHAALDATGRDLADLDVAFAGLGSIGASSLELLLSLAARPPRGLLLCDVAGSGPRLTELGRRLRERGLTGDVRVVEAQQVLPDAVYDADLLVTAVSGATTVLDVDRLRPGAVVVDDSFPHCFDTGRALARMRQRNDVLIVGGGLLHVGTARREPAADLPAVAAAGHLAQPWIEGTLASCRTESLLWAATATARSELPLVHGLVDAEAARAHWRAVERAGVTAAPLHLLGHTLDADPTGGAVARR
ncbi:amino acid adenylation domain-containing protein [Streptomyces sp. NPDC101219]|uniref:amino acid adenylation domain-containing protein n=1 Tax=Streptomyces sp. NPDC101219 TaxID=3366131 RepID=UPI00380228AF